MKTYIVSNAVGEGLETVAVFSSRTRANDFVEKYKDKMWYPVIEEYETDPISIEDDPYIVTMDLNGEKIQVMKTDISESNIEKHDTHDFNLRDFNKAIIFHFNVKDENEAVEMAKQKYFKIEKELEVEVQVRNKKVNKW